MNANDIYSDIAQRTGGDIYIGVVGPVRTGKSTFIQKFMETLVIPNISSEYMRQRAIDELPQSAAGKTIMTTEPKFIPEEAVKIDIGDTAQFNVRMIDCVGYIVPSALGYIENDQPRMVVTPWFEDEIPFNMAAEIGTSKVINEHSTIGLVITTDGSISDIPRAEYEECEERVISELQAIDKPFVILMNSTDPKSERVINMCKDLQEKYSTPVIPVDCITLDENDIKSILTQILFAFPIKEINVCMPKWITCLDKEHWLKKDIFDSIKAAAKSIEHVREVRWCSDTIAECKYVEQCSIKSINLGKGSTDIEVTVDHDLFYKVLGEVTGIEITNESELMPQILELARIKKAYQKIEKALQEVEVTGYGIVMPSIDEMTLEEPEMIKQGGKYGVKLRATAPSIHMMKADIKTEVSPIIGSEKQSEDLVEYLLSEFKESPEKIWDSNVFGKSLNELVNEGLLNKLYKMPDSARTKLQGTVERVINEGCNGLICFIL